MAQINNIVRTQNYKRTYNELESAKTRISELEAEVKALKSGKEATEAAAAAFEIVADAIKLQNDVSDVLSYFPVGDSFETDPGVQDLYFDNGFNKKLLKIKSVVCEPVDGKIQFTVNLDKAEDLCDKNGKVLKTVQALQCGTLNAFTPADKEFGDVAECTSFKATIENPVGSGTKDTFGVSTDNKCYVKGDLVESPSLGEVVSEAATALFEVGIEVDNEENPTKFAGWLGLARGEDDPEVVLGLRPVPAEKQE